MKALITGATGFIGSHLIEVLTDNNWSVRALVRASSDTRSLESRTVERASGDVRDAETLPAAMKGVDVVFHAAALVGEWGSPKDFHDANVVGMKNMIDAASKAGVKRFIDISSTSVHGFEGFNHDTEQLPYRKSGVLYSDSKMEAEQMVWEAHAEGRISATTIRPCMVWGPRDRAFMAKIIIACKRRMFTYIDGGDQIAGLAHVRNVCDAIHLAALKPEAAGKAFIITDGCETTVRQMVEKICDDMGMRRPKMSVSYSVAKTLASSSENIFRKLNSKKAPLLTKMGVAILGNSLSFDITRAREVLGYKPQYIFPNGLQAYLDWFKSEYSI